ncbi:hypothetical protein BD770DRAFT_413104 [Pilaira anomala]|nr:hypothetical protein BD770DRAFT_413104 [Pilaira anomala]
MLVMTTLLSYHENGILVFSINQLPALLGTLIYTCLFRFIQIDKTLQQEVEQQHGNYQQELQQIIDEALNIYDDKQQLFLTTVSKEIRDASLMVMATLEQFLPPSILTNTHELLSGCSIASISAINTTIKKACHEVAIKHALINLLRNILDGCTPGDCIELGLFVTAIPDTPRVKVVFDIIQIASPAIPT